MTSSPHTAALRAPGAMLMLLEGRAPWEFAALLAATPWLRKLPRGDGHPVLVFPGLGANDVTTVPLRRLLDDLGYETHPWRQGFNFGPRKGVLDRATDDVRKLFDRHQRPVSLVGWSLGGLYARELAKELPEHAPLRRHPGHALHRPPARHQCLAFLRTRQRPPDPRSGADGRTAPCTAGAHDLDLFAHRRHRVVALQRQRARPADREHRGSRQPRRHGPESAALFAVADRLAQPPGQWKPFDPSGARRWFFRTGVAAA